MVVKYGKDFLLSVLCFFLFFLLQELFNAQVFYAISEEQFLFRIFSGAFIFLIEKQVLLDVFNLTTLAEWIFRCAHLMSVFFQFAVSTL